MEKAKDTVCVWRLLFRLKVGEVNVWEPILRVIGAAFLLLVNKNGGCWGRVELGKGIVTHEGSLPVHTKPFIMTCCPVYECAILEQQPTIMDTSSPVH